MLAAHDAIVISPSHAVSLMNAGNVITGSGGLPKAVVTAADGARIEVYLHGAQVTSWHPAGSTDDRLYMSPLARFAPGSAIRGGIPVCFPQFADQGTLPMHGFARDAAWQLVTADRSADGAAYVHMRLTDSPATRALWPHAFACDLEAHARGSALVVTFTIVNTDGAPVAFTTALHTYLHVRNVHDTVVRGLSGARYRDKRLGQTGLLESAPELALVNPLDRVYHVVPDSIEVREPHRGLTVQATGATDTVVWNPGPPNANTAPDLAPDSYLSMLCVEAAVAKSAITLPPGGTWRISQTLTAIA